MATYKIEMTDVAVRSFVHDLRELLGGVSASHIADILEAQIPVPAPTKLGAVVRTERGVFLLADPGAELCWAQPISPTDSPDWFIDGGIGRITEVLSEGVDL